MLIVSTRALSAQNFAMRAQKAIFSHYKGHFLAFFSHFLSFKGFTSTYNQKIIHILYRNVKYYVFLAHLSRRLTGELIV